MAGGAQLAQVQQLPGHSQVGLILLGHKRNILCYNCFVRTASPRPSPQEQRFAAYLEGLAKAAGHRDRKQPLKDYCRGLLLPGQRKSI